MLKPVLIWLMALGVTQVEELEALLATLRSQAGAAAGTLVDDRTKQESLLARVGLLPNPVGAQC